MSTIRETIERVVGPHNARTYRTYIDQVVTALEEREQGICEEVVAAAQGQDIEEDTARGVLADAGLTVRESTTSGGGDDLRDVVQSLVAFARQHGFRG